MSDAALVLPLLLVALVERGLIYSLEINSSSFVVRFVLGKASVLVSRRRKPDDNEDLSTFGYVTTVMMMMKGSVNSDWLIPDLVARSSVCGFCLHP